MELEKKITLPVNFCRDRHVFDTNTPKQNLELLGQDQNKVTWSRKDDIREFNIPASILLSFPKNNNLFRDIIACVSQMYIDAKCPQLETIKTSMRKIAHYIGIAFNGERAAEIDNILTFARFYTIRYQPLYRMQKGKVIEYSSTFGFIESVLRETSVDGVPTSPQTAKVIIKLNSIYAQMLRENLPKAPIPVAALKKANQAPRKLITPTKNLIYQLAARLPKTEIEYTLSSLKNILGYKTNREDRLRKSIENVINQLYPVMINDYRYMPEQKKYMIKLAGQLRSNMPTQTSKGETQYAKK